MTRFGSGDDWHTRTPDDAARWERERARVHYDDRRPSRSDLGEEARLDEVARCRSPWNAPESHRNGPLSDEQPNPGPAHQRRGERPSNRLNRKTEIPEPA